MPVSGEVHDGELCHEAEEHLILVEDVDVVHEAIIMAEPLLAEPLEAVIEEFHPPPARPRTAVWGVS